MNRTTRRHLFALLILVPIGLSTKWYSGPFEQWVGNSSGGILYEMFWIWLIGILRPQGRPWISGIIVFSVTTGIEFLQLWHCSVLENIRASFVGRTLIGTSFTWMDLPYYAIGTMMGVIGSIYMKGRNDEKGLRKKGNKNPPTG